MDNPSPIARACTARATLHEALGDVDVGAQIVREYESARRARMNATHTRERSLFDSIKHVEIPFTEELATQQLAVFATLTRVHTKACAKERDERVKTTAELRLRAQWARDLPRTRELLLSHYRVYPRYQSGEEFLTRYVTERDAIDLGELIVELAEQCANDARVMRPATYQSPGYVYNEPPPSMRWDTEALDDPVIHFFDQTLMNMK